MLKSCKNSIVIVVVQTRGRDCLWTNLMERCIRILEMSRRCWLNRALINKYTLLRLNLFFIVRVTWVFNIDDELNNIIQIEFALAADTFNLFSIATYSIYNIPEMNVMYPKIDKICKISQMNDRHKIADEWRGFVRNGSWSPPQLAEFVSVINRYS